MGRDMSVVKVLIVNTIDSSVSWWFDDSRHKTGTGDISVASVSGSYTCCGAVASATTVFSGSLTACALMTGSLSLVRIGAWYVGNGTILRRGGRASHKGDHSWFSEILLGREKKAGEKGKRQVVETMQRHSADTIRHWIPDVEWDIEWRDLWWSYLAIFISFWLKLAANWRLNSSSNYRSIFSSFTGAYKGCILARTSIRFVKSTSRDRHFWGISVGDCRQEVGHVGFPTGQRAPLGHVRWRDQVGGGRVSGGPISTDYTMIMWMKSIWRDTRGISSNFDCLS